MGYSTPLSLISAEGLWALFYGTRFDTTITAVIAAPAILTCVIFHYFKIELQKFIKVWLAGGAYWIIGTTAADVIYSNESGKHVTYEVFTASGSESELLLTAIQGHPLITLTAFLLCSVATVVIMRLPLSTVRTKSLSVVSFILTTLVWLSVTILVVRGGWHDHPQSPMSAYKIGKNDHAYVTWNAPYSITYYLFIGNSEAAHKLTKSANPAIFSELYQEQLHSQKVDLDNLKQANIIFVLMESWTSIDMASYTGHTDAAPYFDELRKSSLTTKAMYANGYRTVQGMFSGLCSYVNPISGVIANTQLQNEQYSCLPHMLTEKGWSTHFIQGSGMGVVGSYAQSIGFTHSYGKTDYSFDSDMNRWGYFDDSIFKFTLDKIDSLQNSEPEKPFMIAINTNTQHGVLVPGWAEYKYGNDTLANIRRSVLKHSDDELSRFIPKLNALLKAPTLVVLMSDHTSKITIEGGLSVISIPFLMYATDGSIPAKNLDESASQRDVTPTILEWLGGSAPWFSGESMLSGDYKGFASFSVGSRFNWVHKNKRIQLESSTGELIDCSIIEDDTITLQSSSCDQDWVQPLYQQGRDFNELTQELLFNGKTMDYRKLESIFPEQ
ncbi:LTA synthase family protein [Vibrio tapetis subsp. quintayensis]|uniref:LTA synthase family protein n=1 Tax=Vibrio tapetis TaxID=52443 RepID=UPI0025B5D1D2|nr:LTA synthase family protein [Vibrio tapetis]MDN3679527.1 LTA synthase family protein [Vibrio tapetis subsp. quintayensis]